ncbi:MAG: arylesterase [Proteobacteria bacterium]|nr:arylesterase [Pseudomonadota bacterium]
MPRAERTSACVAMFGSIARLFIVVCLSWAPAAAAGTILVYGDSLSAAYGIAQERGWVALLEARLKREKANYSVANASISGETTSGGLSRMKKVLERHRPAITVIELGANDGLRGLPVAEMRRNLAAMIREARAARSRVLLVGVKMPPNYGADYTRAFEAAYTDLANEYKTGLVPFLFEGVAEKRENFQADNLHPTAEAQPILLENVWKALKPMLK